MALLSATVASVFSHLTPHESEPSSVVSFSFNDILPLQLASLSHLHLWNPKFGCVAAGNLLTHLQLTGDFSSDLSMHCAQACTVNGMSGVILSSESTVDNGGCIQFYQNIVPLSNNEMNCTILYKYATNFRLGQSFT